ncbi:MAG: T9SS C-terminal target domain-containing protein, partial [Bacteroidetes bacterium]
FFSEGVPREVITIPVVVHVVWNKPEQNISDDQILSQIDVLNEDFNAQNVEIADIPTEFKDLVANVGIEFCLAKRDPQGNPASGITRTFTEAPAILGSKNIHYKSLGGADAWDPEHYLNIWVANGSSINGFGAFPGEKPPEEDGVEIKWDVFGREMLNPPYHLGRTATHEIGHYFNLFHPWSDDCSDGDLVADTPPSNQSYLGECPTHPAPSCGSNDLFMNFMYWTDDACMGMFTEGQKMRMLATLSGPRAGLTTSKGCLAVGVGEPVTPAGFVVLPNPSRSGFEVKWLGQTGTAPLTAVVYSARGERVFFDIKHSLSTFYIDTNGWVPGIYFLKIMDGKSIWVKKIIL